MSSSDNLTRRLLLKALAAAPVIPALLGTTPAQAQTAKAATPACFVE